MKELELLNVIKKTLSKSSYIGDDCAYLDKLGIVITQDSLVENIHFCTEFSTPYQIGYKAIIVNISDILASGAIPKYVTISLSLPPNIKKIFVEDFYKACNDLAEKFDFEIVGGDITGSEQIFISVCAIGITKGRKISSRKNAKIGDYVITTGPHGSSAAGLALLQNNVTAFPHIVKSHIIPEIETNFSTQISTKADREYAMMDTSDGLVDALFKIAQSSNALISVDYDKITYDKDLEKIAELTDNNYNDWILYGGEDYKIIACINEENLSKIDKSLYTVIGKVIKKEENHFVEININNEILKIHNLEKTYNHFKKD